MQSHELQMNPAQVCETLGITPIEIKRLVKDGHLEIKNVVNFKNGKMNLYNSRQVESLINLMPRIKQAWECNDALKYGASKLARNKVYRQKTFRKNVESKNKFFQEIEMLPGDVKVLLHTCFYLFHLNHYAKAGDPYLYDLKEMVLSTLVKKYYKENGDQDSLLQAVFIEGENKIILCSRCKSRAKKRKISHVDYLEKYGGCSKCSKGYKYYSLYEFNISYDNYRFCFHTPYSTGKKWFKDKKSLPPKKQSSRREGAYIFGRSIFNSEAQAVELIEAIEELQNFLADSGHEPLIETKTRVL